MPYLVLGVAIVIGVVFLVRGLRGMEPRRIMVVLRVLLVVAAIGAVVFFALEHGPGATIAAAMFLLPLLIPLVIVWLFVAAVRGRKDRRREG